uniref:Uncharacterized protein n=1 Tax=Zea mays TaxID=4577 RepID=B6T1R9_MAIZE|nr:hypothetical protein [Zea mays]
MNKINSNLSFLLLTQIQRSIFRSSHLIINHSNGGDRVFLLPVAFMSSFSFFPMWNNTSLLRHRSWWLPP